MKTNEKNSYTPPVLELIHIDSDLDILTTSGGYESEIIPDESNYESEKI